MITLPHPQWTLTTPCVRDRIPGEFALPCSVIQSPELFDLQTVWPFLIVCLLGPEERGCTETAPPAATLLYMSTLSGGIMSPALILAASATGRLSNGMAGMNACMWSAYPWPQGTRISQPFRTVRLEGAQAKSTCMLQCRAPGVLVLVDAAHALGQQPLSIAALGADFVAANCHKWLGGARGSAVLWAARAQQAHLRPLVVSHGHGHGFTSDFIWDGAPPHHALVAWLGTHGDARSAAVSAVSLPKMSA